MIALTSPVRTPWHRVPPAPKLLALFALTFVAVAQDDPWPLAGMLAAVIVAYGVGGWAFLRHGAASLRPLWPLLAVILLWHVLLQELAAGVVMALRIAVAMSAANLVTMTTRLDAMIALLQRVLPTRFGRVAALAIALMIRFIPEVSVRHALARDAWRARSPRRPGWRVVPPVLLGTLDDADRVAEALRARGGMS